MADPVSETQFAGSRAALAQALERELGIPEGYEWEWRKAVTLDQHQWRQVIAALRRPEPAGANSVSETPRTKAVLAAEWQALIDAADQRAAIHWRDNIALREQVAKLEAELFTAEHEQGSLLTRAERAEARAEAVPQLVEALQKIVNAADTFPFCPVGHLLEHSDINARAALDAAKEQSRG